jgi:hypothetical protein
MQLRALITITATPAMPEIRQAQAMNTRFLITKPDKHWKLTAHAYAEAPCSGVHSKEYTM